MRDQAELARECLAAEERGEDVIAYLKGRGFISPRATWERLQINYLGRGKRNWKGEIQLAEKMKKNQKVTNEQKARAVEIAIQGGDPLAYLQACGSGNATSLWYMIRQALQKTDPGKYETLMANYKPASGRKKKAETKEEAPVETVEEPEKPMIFAPFMYDGSEAIGWKFPSGRFYHDADKDFIDFDNGADELSLSIEEWKQFLKDLVKAALLFGIDLGVDLRD